MKNKNASRWAFVINPAAGGGKSAKYIRYLRDFKHTLHPEIDLFITKRSGDATKICDRLVSGGYRKFVAVGGDGTFNEVIQSLAKRNDCVLGVFPSGTGNDYAPGAGFPDHYEPWELADLFRCKAEPVDVGVCNGRYFLNNFGVGFDAKVAHDFQAAKRIPASLRYWVYVFRNIFCFSPSLLSLTHDGKKETMKTMLVSVGIGRRCGGGFQLTPKALLDDGVFDVCAVTDCAPFTRITHLLAVRSKKHIGRKGIEYFTAKKLTFEFESLMPAHLDGEIVLGKFFDVSVLPGRIKLLIHPERENFLRTKR